MRRASLVRALSAMQADRRPLVDWQEVLDVGRADAHRHRSEAIAERANARHCTDQAHAALNADATVLWLMRAMQQRLVASNSDAASEVSDRIADHAEHVLRGAA